MHVAADTALATSKRQHSTSPPRTDTDDPKSDDPTPPNTVTSPGGPDKTSPFAMCLPVDDTDEGLVCRDNVPLAPAAIDDVPNDGEDTPIANKELSDTLPF